MVTKHFYVTVRDGKRTGFLMGPYIVRGDAERRVEQAKKQANEADAFAVFYAYGIASMPLTVRPTAVFGQ